MLPILLRHAVALGALVALGEVAWSYALPDLVPGRRVSVPDTSGGLATFIGAAVITDVGLGVVAALVLGGLLGLLGRLAPRWRASRLIGGLCRSAAYSGGLAFLVIAWLGRFVLQSDQSRTLIYQLQMAGALAACAAAGTIAAWLVAVLRRRVHRVVPVVLWSAASLAILLSTARSFAAYRTAREAERVVVVPSAPAQRPNILLFTLDTLRADFIACYGNAWVKTPNLDALAADGTLFGAAISQAPTTGPSHCSIMTSIYPLDHEGFNGKPMKAGLVTLADVLRANGYETAAFTAATTTGSLSTGLQQGFDVYNDSLVSWSSLFSHDEFQNLNLFYLVGIANHSEVRGDVVTGRALDWLSRRPADRPFFAWVHYFDPHADYAAPEPYFDMYKGQVPADLPMASSRERYAGEVTFTDAQVGRVIDELKKRGLYENTVIVVTADHGEGFGEQHGLGPPDRGHGANLYEATQHVPLIVRAPVGRGKQIGEQVELIDIAPTILAAVGLDRPTSFVGKPLMELLEGRRYSYAQRAAYAFTTVGVRESTAPDDPLRFVHKLAMRTPQLKYIGLSALMTVPELYELERDPGETRNVFELQPQVCRERHEILMRFLGDRPLETTDPRTKVAPTLVNQLKGLGYMGGDEEEEQGAKDDDQ